MHRFHSSTTEISNNLRKVCNESYLSSICTKERTQRIDDLGNLVALLEIFIRGYELIEDDNIDTDDEILNWAFGEVPGDLCAAIWSLSTGFYKTSASCLRNAYDIGFASLYFQVRENTNPRIGGYNKFFAEWDEGLRQTPNWGESKSFIANQPTVTHFNKISNCNMVDALYEHFKYLCSYTHTSAFTPNGNPVTAINSTGVCPVFDETMFNRMCELTENTVSLLTISWQVVFPKIMDCEPLGPLSSPSYDLLFKGDLGSKAKNYRGTTQP